MPDLTSLPAAIDSLDDLLFREETLSAADKEAAGRHLLSRQLPSGEHAGLLSPSREELASPILLFTGERLHTHLGPRNVLSAEAARLCPLLGLTAPGLEAALQRLQEKLARSCFARDLCVLGECAHSGLAYMRLLASGLLPSSADRLEAHLHILSQKRDGRGGWLRFPRHYTLLVLAEIDLPAATAELRYAALHRPGLPRKAGGLAEKHLQRRRILWERILARC